MIQDGVLVGAQVHKRGAWVLGCWDFLGSRAFPADDERPTMRMGCMDDGGNNAKLTLSTKVPYVYVP